MPLLEVNSLQTHFRPQDDVHPAVDGVSCQDGEAAPLGVLRASGCGKSVTARSILRLVPESSGTSAGSIRSRGVYLLGHSDKERRRVRGNAISMIFQEPMTSVNPVLTVGRQLGETLRLHQRVSRREAAARAVEMLRLVGI